jgi:hypothetical protein
MLLVSEEGHVASVTDDCHNQTCLRNMASLIVATCRAALTIAQARVVRGHPQGLADSGM